MTVCPSSMSRLTSAVPVNPVPPVSYTRIYASIRSWATGNTGMTNDRPDCKVP
jgi:hypothetical protein